MCELSIVILGYKAGSFLEEFVDKVFNEVNSTLSLPFEIILVANYDNEKDPTPIIAQRLAKKYDIIKVLSLKKEGKMGWDMRKGFEESRGNYICVLDGDGQMPASDIMNVYSLIKTNNFELVKTYRSIREDGWLRKVLSYVYNMIFNLLYQPPIQLKDVNSKPKILTRSAYNQLNIQSNDWFTDAEIIIQAIDLKFRIAEISTIFYKNDRRKSFVNMRTVLEFTYNLFYYRFKN